MRKLSLALIATLCFMGISSAAGATSVNMVITGIAFGGAGGVSDGNSVTLNPSGTATMTVDVVLDIDTAGLGAFFVNFLFDTDLKNEVNLLTSSELSWGNMSGNRKLEPISPGIDASVESTGANGGSVFQFDGTTLNTGPLSTTLTFARLVFSTNHGNVSTDGEDIFVDSIQTLLVNNDNVNEFGPVSTGISVNLVPEPGTVVLLGLGIGSLALAGRRRGRK